MNSVLEKVISNTRLYDWVSDSRHKKELYQWVEKFRPCPPPHLIKQSVVKEYARRFSLETLIETGTYLGFMVRSTRSVVRRVYSIELDETLYRRAKKKFSNDEYITILQGDSGEVLSELLTSIHEPCLFWLDAHYSSGAMFKTGKGKLLTPIISELQYILTHEKAQYHVILIDDAREFTGENDYPRIKEIEVLVQKLQPSFVLEVMEDIIRLHKK